MAKKHSLVNISKYYYVCYMESFGSWSILGNEYISTFMMWEGQIYHRIESLLQMLESGDYCWHIHSMHSLTIVINSVVT